MGDGRAGIQNSSLISIVNPATTGGGGGGGDGVRRRNTVNYFRLRENVSPLNPLPFSLPLSAPNFLRMPRTRLASRLEANQPLPLRELFPIKFVQLSIPIRLRRSLETSREKVSGGGEAWDESRYHDRVDASKLRPPKATGARPGYRRGLANDSENPLS